MSTYTYSVATNFGGIPPSINVLQNEIVSQITSPSLTNIGFLGDSLIIIFSSALSPAQVSILDSLCVPGNFGGEILAADNFSFANTLTKSPFTVYSDSSYREILQIKYSGSAYFRGSPTQLSVIASSGNVSNGNFNLQIKDLSTNLIVATLTVSGNLGISPSGFSTNSFSNISTLPTTWSISIIGSPSGSPNSSTNLYSLYLRYV